MGKFSNPTGILRLADIFCKAAESADDAIYYLQYTDPRQISEKRNVIVKLQEGKDWTKTDGTEVNGHFIEFGFRDWDAKNNTCTIFGTLSGTDQAESHWNLWIDDQLDEVPGRKTPPGFLGAKSVEEAKELVIAHGIPEVMDLDHDLGEESVMTFLKWLADEFPDGPVPEWEVHSQNPIGKQNINSFLDSWQRSLAFDINDITKCAQIVEPLGYEPPSPTIRFSKVDDMLYRGGKPSPEHLIHFKRGLGINKILSLDGQVGYEIDNFCRALGLKHPMLPLGDGRDPKVKALKAYIPYLTNDGPTYIHCYWGKDRTSMAVAMYRIHNGWSLEDALNEAHRFHMGEGLSKDVRDSYYNAVRDFAKEHGADTSNAQDAVSSSRETNTFGIGNPGVNDMSIPQFSVHFNIPPSTDIEFSHLSRVAAFSKAFGKSVTRGRYE